ncbi:MAG: hypothetical protein GC155_13120 [Alphaproteobacteria bacterium]|nr:hypothetical protein [Alphaproteobacteria bacterium]
MRFMLAPASALAMILVGQANAQNAPDPYKVNPFLGKATAAPAVPAASSLEAATSLEAIAESRAEMAKPRSEPGYSPPRLSDGHPDLQGVWSNASNTVLTRPAKFSSLVMNDAEAAKARREHPQNIRQATDDNQKEADGLLNGRDLAAGRGYNSFWIDPGTNYSLTKGTWCTSWIVDPPNGQIPYSEDGRKWLASHRRDRGNGFDNPEERSLAERCIFFGRSAGPPLTNGLYNNNYRITQSANAVAIEAEMIHETRIIRLNAKHDPAVLNRYAGDSIGWWEGDTLVVETVNMNSTGGGSAPLTPSGKIIERFTRYNEKQVLYEFEVDDPALYTQVWKGEMGLNAAPNLYEYACHEGNYGLSGILSGGRANDRKGVSNFQNGRREE